MKQLADVIADAKKLSENKKSLSFDLAEIIKRRDKDIIAFNMKLSIEQSKVSKDDKNFFFH